MQINETIWNLWQQNPSLRWVWTAPNHQETAYRVPKFVVVPQQKCKLVSLGINPSFPRVMPTAVKLHLQTGDLVPATACIWGQSGLNEAFDERIATIHAKSHLVAEEHGYGWFPDVNELAAQLTDGASYHVDAFLPLAQSMACLPDMYRKARNYQLRAGPQHPTPEAAFVSSQLDICYQLLQQCAPTFIVAPYAFAADALKTHVCCRHHQDPVSEELSPTLRMITLRTDWSNEVQLFRFSKRQGLNFADCTSVVRAIVRTK